jgi:hypothetical protein
MKYKLTIYKKPKYLHAIVTGQNSRENVERYLREVVLECKNANCSRLLIEERLEGPRLKMLDIFQIVSEESKGAIGKFNAIAYVDIHSEGKLMQFAETVAVNRAVPVMLFSTVQEAEKWLNEGDEEGI